jgi:DNA-binding MurR/RpiR family transcriptional regulator
VPFEVELTPPLITHLQAQHIAESVKPRRIVAQISYAGDERGIVRHLQSDEGGNTVVVSLTHLRLHRSLPFAAAVLDYRKHRVKNLKKQGLR